MVWLNEFTSPVSWLDDKMNTYETARLNANVACDSRKITTVMRDRIITDLNWDQRCSARAAAQVLPKVKSKRLFT